MSSIADYEKFFKARGKNLFQIRNRAGHSIIQHAALYGNFEMLHRYLLGSSYQKNINSSFKIGYLFERDS